MVLCAPFLKVTHCQSDTASYTEVGFCLKSVFKKIVPATGPQAASTGWASGNDAASVRIINPAVAVSGE